MRFLFILGIFIIAFIAFFAEHLNEEGEPPLNEQSDSVELIKPDIKPKRLLEAEEGDWGSYPEEHVTKDTINKEQEAIVYEAINNNIVAFYKNTFVQAYPNSEVFVVPEGMAADLANNIKNKSSDLTKDLLNDFNSINNINPPSSATTSSPSSTTTDDMNYIISMFIDGSKISVFTPTDASVATPASLEKDPHNTPIDTPTVEQSKPSKPAVVIVTNKVNEGDPVPPLPGWVHLNFSNEDYHIKRHRMDQLFNSEYVYNHTDNTKPSNRNQEWLDNEDLNLDMDSRSSSSKKDGSNEV